MLYGMVPIAIAWSILCTCTYLPAIYCARLLCGISYSISLCIVPIYLAEIASTRIRGRLTILASVANQVGILLPFCVGPYVDYWQVSYVATIPLALFLASACCLIESPYYLLAKNRDADALLSLTKLRGGGGEVVNDQRSLQCHEELADIATTVNRTKINDKLEIVDIFCIAGNRRALGILFLLTMAQCCSGGFTITVYAEIIFTKIGTASVMSPQHVSIIFAGLQLVASIFSAIFIDRWGRRTLLMSTMVGMTIGYFVLATYFFRLRFNVSTLEYWPVSVVALMVITACFTAGVGVVVYCYIGELFRPNMKKIAILSYNSMSALMVFSSNKCFQIVSDDVGSDVSFVSYAVILMCLYPLVWWFVPETKGKSLDRILIELNDAGCGGHHDRRRRKRIEELDDTTTSTSTMMMRMEDDSR